MSIISLERAAKRYHNVEALKEVSLSLGEGEVLGLFGHNGAGKTTTIKLILGLLTPDQGKVSVLGMDPASNEFRSRRQQIGFLQENVSFYDQLTGFEVLRYFARLKGVGMSQCDTLLQELGLDHACHRKVRTYSKGMRQRLGLAQAMLGNPRLLLLDEPTVGLDPVATRAFYQSIQRLKDQGCTVVLCSHVLPGVEQYIDQAAILGHGRLLAQGTIEQLRLQADLPLQLTLRGDAIEQGMPAEWQTRIQHSEPGQVVVKGNLQEKVNLWKTAAAIPGVEDFQWQVPSLEDLYSHFCEQEDRSCAAY
ncbi:ABC transporter ATP-binding protein [Aestuariirhabdus sp. Z084]|uniref:ABC transporter ATP-binding protein n=1 Tax=Aestuariirhabdus haliotis TaxID=2918751 RepID=UPI00201B4454|nr:ABC transporter ATP-binding protein [Aestuariirhabdus haliotis]MCL6416660.1 ABC transporter ATP-binding protein [Aestuariirhabdus haliotis]MCL6421094.1 ABC transporter ATP-binding protein [Aestuariirhabdus haliotis]